jgi:hypothetical protein
MSHVTPAPHAPSDTESGPPTAICALRKHAPVLITENQVAFSTAAARPIGSNRRRLRDITLMGGLGRIRIALTQPRPHQPRRQLAYFETARMSRTMDQR